MILGITGGTGSGKTTLLKLIGQRGGMVLDCDEIYYALLNRDEALLQKIDARFPGTVEAGCLQRKKLGAWVFADPAALQDLNAITHGAVREEVRRRLESAPALVGIDAIGLFESGLDSLCDVTVAVTAPRETRIARLMARDGISMQYAAARIDAQPSDGVFRDRCSYLLENTGTPEEFRNKCLDFLNTIGIISKNAKEGDHLCVTKNCGPLCWK